MEVSDGAWNELLARVHRAEVKANNANGVAQATRANAVARFVSRARYREDRDAIYAQVEEAAAASRRSLMLMVIVATIAIGSFFGVAAFERSASRQLNQELQIVEMSLRQECQTLADLRDASREHVRLAADLAPNGDRRERLLAIIEDYPEPVQCGSYGLGVEDE